MNPSIASLSASTPPATMKWRTRGWLPRHFNCKHYEYYITPNDLMHAIPLVAAHYDQPFGNSSALPAFYCARLAREHGVDKLLAGDGGDELFGGNTRYARQKVFDAYRCCSRAGPGGMRLNHCYCKPSAARRLRVESRKLVSYVDQARLPMPERMESYNLLDRFGAHAVFTPAFLNRVQGGEPKRPSTRGLPKRHCTLDRRSNACI